MANVYIRRRPASVGSNRVQDWALVIQSGCLSHHGCCSLADTWHRTRLPEQTERLTSSRKSAGRHGMPGLSASYCS